MVTRRREPGNTHYTILNSGMADLPMLLPIAENAVALRSAIRFCHRVDSKAPILVLNPDIYRAKDAAGAAPSADLLVDRIALLTTDAVRQYGLQLEPVVAIGIGEGAHLAAKFVLRHDALVSACILLRPTARLSFVEPGALRGLSILLARATGEEAVGTVGWQVMDVLAKAGADLIIEGTHCYKAWDAHEAAISRVFIKALFGSQGYG